MGTSWSQSFRREFKVKKIRLWPSRPEVLLQPQWKIHPFVWLFYRFFMLVYTLGCCVYLGLYFGTPKCLIFLSNIAYILLGLYYFVAFLNLARVFIYIRRFSKTKRRDSSTERPAPFTLPKPLVVSLHLQWFLHAVSGSFSLSVSVLYWSMIRPFSNRPLSVASVLNHVINSMQILLDLFLSTTPVHLCHYLYVFLVGALYVLFAFLYWCAGGTNVSGQPYIYDALDFGGSPVMATLSALGFCLVCLPFFHFVLWNVQLLRDWLVDLKESVFSMDAMDFAEEEPHSLITIH